MNTIYAWVHLGAGSELAVYQLIYCLLFGVVGGQLASRPYSGFHMYFSILVPWVLIGCWSRSLRDRIIGAYYCKAMRRV